jgi:hypothetical protein
VSPGALKNGFRAKPAAPSAQEGEKGGSVAKASAREAAAGKPEDTTAASRASEKLGVDISDYVWVGTRLVRKDELERERESQENGTSTGEDAQSRSNESK